MHIRKLELQGFKSFADRAAFNFGPGISGVVGPNGCGKSNVIDAVKWCIGEQSAKSLRGDSMSDVIFAGSAGRSAVNFAEVSLTFTAGDEPFPGIWQRFEELEVTRRLFRDGHSEYLINQERVRLRDITDLFMDSGVGNQLYSVIEQGRIGLIVHAKPEQRRTLIEEAAGISRYKARREETMSRLADTRASLERVADIAEEMSRQLRSAERQVQRVVRWRTLNARVRQEEIAVGLVKCAGLLADRRALSDQERALGAELEEAARTVDRLEEELVAKRSALETLEEEANRVRDRLAEIEAQRRVEESASQYQARESQQARDRLSRLDGDQASAREERDEAIQQAADAAARRVASDAALALARAEADGAGVRVRTAEEGVRVARAALESARSASMSAYEAMVRARSAGESARARLADLEGRAARNAQATQSAASGSAHIAEELARVAEQVAAAEALAATARRAVDDAVATAKRTVEVAQGGARASVEERQRAGRAALDARQADARARVEAAQLEGRRAVDAAQSSGKQAVELEQGQARASVEAVRAAAARADSDRETALAELRAADSRLTEAARERERVATRLGALEEMQRANTELPDGVRAALAVEGALGLLASQLDVPAALEGVLLRALDGALDTVLVPDWDTAARVAAAAKGARARILVVPAEAPVRGIAADIPGAEHARRALSMLLGDLEIVDDLGAAAGVWRSGCRVVTRDGALLREDGLVILGGEAQSAGAAALRRRREIGALKEELGQRDAQQAACTEAVAAVRARVDEAQGAARAAAGAVESAQQSANARVQAAQQSANAAVQAAQQAANAAVQAAQASGAQDVQVAQGALTADVQAAQAAAAQAVQEAQVEANAATEAARAALREREAVVAEHRHRLREMEAERARATRTQEGALAEAKAIASQRASAEADAARAADDMRASGARHEASEDEVRRRLGELERLEPELAQSSEILQRARLDAATLQKDLSAATTEERAATERGERAGERARLIASERSDLESRLVELAVQAEASAKALQELGEQQGVVREELQGLRDRLAEDRERVKTVEASTRAARDRRDTARDRLSRVETRLAEVRASVERVRGDVEEKHGVSLPGLLDRMERDGQILLEGHTPPPDALGGEDVPTLRLTPSDLDADITERAEALAQARDALSRIGEVNFAAEDEYREVSARHADIERQRTDLVEAMDVIEKAIAKINRTCRERFRETFDLVAAHFAEIYPRLVGGGSGRLQLTDEEDLLTCGVEMMVQPPGKRVQNLSLLSGGEKAMAAIGLIFSLFRVKPSPFCLLDEVDAPLDEGNGGRFNDMLREMSAVSQFIVITHNKKTMECADVLYGVTMPEPGTSRLVTVRID